MIHLSSLPEFNLDPTVADELLSPTLDILRHDTRSSRDCPGVSDEDFVHLGILRTLSQCKSGRDFLQQQAEVFANPLTRATFFNSLHSRRRLELLEEISGQSYLRGIQTLREQGSRDLLDLFPEVSGRPVWAVDGHHIEHACHALRDAQGRHVSVNTLYVLCLHTGLMANLAPVQGNGIYGHEMPVFREAMPRFLERQGKSAFKGKPLFILDLAYIDNPFWERCRQIQQAGAVMITRLKENMKPERAQPRDFEEQDPVNFGVEADLKLHWTQGTTMRLVVFTDPETGQCHEFLTTDFELRPGVIAWLYLMRWRLEKVYDTAKNKLQEHKAWANGPVAQQIQAHFLALSHNALILFREKLDGQHGIREEKLEARRAEALKRRAEAAEAKGFCLHPLSYELPAIVQLSLQFIRSVRNYIIANAPLKSVLDQFRAMLYAYL